jgi:hypothetical protein
MWRVEVLAVDVQWRAWCAFIGANAETLDRFFPRLPDRCRSGALNKGRNSVCFLIPVRSYAFKGWRYGQDTGSHKWGAENTRHDRRLQRGNPGGVKLRRRLPHSILVFCESISLE